MTSAMAFSFSDSLTPQRREIGFFFYSRDRFIYKCAALGCIKITVTVVITELEKKTVLLK